MYAVHGLSVCAVHSLSVYAVHGLSCVCCAWSEVTCDAGNSARLALRQGFHIYFGQANQLASKRHLAEGIAHSVMCSRCVHLAEGIAHSVSVHQMCALSRRYCSQCHCAPDVYKS